MVASDQFLIVKINRLSLPQSNPSTPAILSNELDACGFKGGADCGEGTRIRGARFSLEISNRLFCHF